MVYRVKIADKSHRSAEASHQQIRPAAFPDDDSLPAFNHRDRRDGDRDEIAEERLFIVGRSPDMRTKNVISAKKKPASMIKKIP